MTSIKETTEQIDNNLQRVSPVFVLNGRYCLTYSLLCASCTFFISTTLAVSLTRPNNHHILFFHTVTGFLSWVCFILLWSTLTYDGLFSNNHNKKAIFIRTSVANRASRQVDCLYQIYIREILNDVRDFLVLSETEKVFLKEEEENKNKKRIVLNPKQKRIDVKYRRIIFFVSVAVLGEILGKLLSFFSLCSVLSLGWIIYLVARKIEEKR